MYACVCVCVFAYWNNIHMQINNNILHTIHP